MDPLLERAARDDGDARDQLVRQFSTRLRSYIESDLGAKLRREVSGSDIVQDVFLQVFRSLDSLPSDATLDVFWGRLRRNASWVMARHAKKHSDFLGESAVGGACAVDMPAEEASTGEVTRGDEVRALHGLIDRLDPKYGDVVRLRLEGKRFSEIAGKLDEGETTVRKRYERAHDALERFVEKTDPGGAGAG